MKSDRNLSTRMKRFSGSVVSFLEAQSMICLRMKVLRKKKVISCHFGLDNVRTSIRVLSISTSTTSWSASSTGARGYGQVDDVLSSLMTYGKNGS